MTQVDNYRVGILPPLGMRHAAEIATILDQPSQIMLSTLEGRRKPVSFNLTGMGPVVIKRFARGGLIRFLLDHYVRWRETRAHTELALIERDRLSDPQ